ncbi:MAG: thioredoxin family protein [Bacilli bacterium]|nr:thioredoxin family protein [Bacilli bacterium]
MKIIKINAMWCSGCLSMKKIWKEIEKEYPDLNIIEYDYDLNEEEIKPYNIGEVLPVIILQNDKKEIRLIGEKTKKEILKAVEEINA